MKTFYVLSNFGKMQAGKISTLLLGSLLLLLSYSSIQAQCPTPVITAPAVCAGQPVRLVLTNPTTTAAPYTLVINGTPYTGITPNTPFDVQGQSDNIFGTTVPPIFPDATQNELGVKFRVTANGFIKGIRFYKSAAATGPFTGTLWTIGGAQIATGTFTTSASGWQELLFSAPVPVTTGTAYVASYYSPNGNYPFTSGGLLPTITSPGGFIQTSASGGADGLNGVYRTGGGGFPSNSFNNANYFVDVIFQTNAAPTTYTLTSITDGGLCNNTTSTSSATPVINPTPSGTIAPNGTPTAGGQASVIFTATGVPNNPYALVINGSTFSPVTSGAPFDAGAIPTTQVSRIWTSISLPTPTAANDLLPTPGTSAIEVGLKFKTTVAGLVTGLRFYKGLSNTNPTVLNLYDAAGFLLGTTTHTDAGSSPGFKEATLTNPVFLLPNTTYVVTYFSATGDYVFTGGFLTSDYINGPLTVFANGGSAGVNGVYRYGPAAGLPTLSAGANYWADVVFTNPVVAWPLNLTQITDGNGCSVTVNDLVTQSVNNPLPVSLTEFSARLDQGNNVKLDWSTSSESNNKGFEVIRSTDAAKWLTIGFVDGSGTSSLSRNYSLIDKNLSSGKYFYRLKQVDFDGKFNYSNILTIDVNGKLAYALNQSYPNPSHGASTITYSIPVKSQVTLTVYDMQGRVVRVLQKGERAAGKYAVTVTSDLLKKGVYYYKLEAGEFKSTRKMIVQ